MKKSDAPFRGVSPSSPPDWLRGEVLLAAVQARGKHRPRALVDRLWESRGLRFGWLGAVLVLLALCTLPGADAPAPPSREEPLEELPAGWSGMAGRAARPAVLDSLRSVTATDYLDLLEKV